MNNLIGVGLGMVIVGVLATYGVVDAFPENAGVLLDIWSTGYGGI